MIFKLLVAAAVALTLGLSACHPRPGGPGPVLGVALAPLGGPGPGPFR